MYIYLLLFIYYLYSCSVCGGRGGGNKRILLKRQMSVTFGNNGPKSKNFYRYVLSKQEGTDWAKKNLLTLLSLLRWNESTWTKQLFEPVQKCSYCKLKIITSGEDLGRLLTWNWNLFMIKTSSLKFTRFKIFVDEFT
jgi:hypothetical protein